VSIVIIRMDDDKDCPCSCHQQAASESCRVISLLPAISHRWRRRH